MYLDHQVKKADELLAVLKSKRMACLWGEPRSGKTRTAILTVSKTNVKNVLVLTKKNAVTGWISEIQAVQPDVSFHITNYEQASKLTKQYELAIIDESHNLNKTGRPTQRFMSIRKLTYNLPVIFLSGTPAVEKLSGIYHQFALTKYSPFNWATNFYTFFNYYGIPNRIWISGRQIEQYNKVSDKLLKDIEPYTVRMTQDDAGITSKAIDKVHQVTLDASTVAMIKELKQHSVYEDFYFESDMGVRAAIHQIESGALLYEDEIIMLSNMEVINYVKEVFGDAPDIAYMAHYRSTREKLKQHLPKSVILSSDANAEGVDLSHMRRFVIINSAFSGAKFIQRRERVVNINKKGDAIVNHIITDNGISQYVYQAVSDKRDYNLGMFRRDRATDTEKYS